uniref:ARAD1D33704p n=1 Tax=Blastobotrys adeninivorans TaxID=409370 RepID=A0A060TGV0_BLAAD
MPTPRRKSMPAFMLEDGKENRSRDEDFTLPRPGIKRHSLAPGRSILKASNFDDNNTITVIGSNRDYKRRKVSFAASNRVISFDTNVSSPHTNSNASDGSKSFMSPTKASQQKVADEYRKSPRRSPRLNPSSQILKSPVTFSQERIKPPSPVKFNQKLTTLVPPKSPPGEPEIPESDESMEMETDDSPSSIPSARRHAPTGEGILINFESPAPKRNNNEGEKWNWTIPEEGEEREDTGMDMTHINSYNDGANKNEKEQEIDNGPADDTMQFTSIFKPRSSEDTMQFTTIGTNNPPLRERDDDTMQFTSMFKPRQSDETMQFTAVGPTKPASEARDSDETMQFTRILPPSGEKSPGDTMQFTSVFKPNQTPATNFGKADGDDTMQFTSVLPANSTGHRESEDTMQFTSVFPNRSSAPRESEDTMQFTSIPAARSSAPRESEDTMQFTSVLSARSAAPRESEDTMQFTTIGSNNHAAREPDDDTMQFTSVFPTRSSALRESEDTMQFTSVLPPRSTANRQAEDRASFANFPSGSLSAPRESEDTMQFTTILPGGPAKARDSGDTMQFTSVPSTRVSAPRDSEDTMQFTSIFKPQNQRKEDDMTMEFTKIPKSVRTPKVSHSPAQDKENVRLSLSTKATPPQPPRTAPRTLQEKIALLTPNKAIKVDGTKTTPSKFSPGFVKRTLFAEEQTKFTPLKAKGPKNIVESPSVSSKEAETATTDSGRIGLKKFLEMVEVDFLDGLWSGANRMQDSFGLSNEPMNNPELEDYALAYNQFPTLELYDFGVRQLKERMKDMETELEEIDSEVLENTPELVEQFLNEPGIGRQYMMNLFRNSKILSRAEAKASWYDWRRTLTADVMKAMEKNKRSLEDDISILNSRRETIDESLSKLTNEDAELTKQLEQLESRHKELENFDRDEYEKVQQALLEAKQAFDDAKSEANVIQEVSPDEVELARNQKSDLMKEVQAAEKLQRMNQKVESSMVDEISDKFKSLQKVTGIEQCRLVDNCLTATVFESLRIRQDLPTGKIETSLVDNVKDDNCLTFFHSCLFEGLENPNLAQVCDRWRKVVELNHRMTIFRIKHITNECKIVQTDQADGKHKLKLKVILMLEAQTKAIIDVLIDRQTILTLPQLQGQVSQKITYGQAQLQDLGDSFRSGLDKLDEALTAHY